MGESSIKDLHEHPFIRSLNIKLQFSVHKNLADFMFAETEKQRILTFEICCLFNERKIALMISQTLHTIKTIFGELCEN